MCLHQGIARKDNIIYLILAIAAVVAITSVHGQDRWFRAVHTDGAEDDAPVTVKLAGVRKGDELVGELLISRNVIPGQATGPFVVEGHVTDDGRFVISSRLQVSDDRNGPWRTAASAPDSRQAATVTIFRGLAVTGLDVNVEGLKPFIGKFRFGRVVLKTGEAAVFLLSDLLPPAELQKK